MFISDLEQSAEDLRSNELQISIQRMKNLQEFNNHHQIDSLINISTIEMVGGNCLQAQKVLKKAREMDPFDFRPYYNLFVMKWTTNNQQEAVSNLKKCLSLFYSLGQSNWERSLQLWPGNSAAHAIKIVTLIKQGKVDNVTEAISKALKLSITKQHILQITNIIDTILNKRTDKQQNKGQSNKDNNNQFLLPVPSLAVNQSHEQDFQIQELITQFNKVSQQINAKHQYLLFQSQPRVLFMKAKNRTSIDIQKYISQNLEEIQFTKMKQGESIKKKQLDIKQQKKISNQKQPLLYPIISSSFLIKLIKANLKIKSQIIDNNMLPYINYQYGNQKYTQNIFCSNGLKPSWQSNGKIFSLQRNPAMMKISFYKREIFKWDQEIGTGLFQIIIEGNHNSPIYYKEKQVGKAVFSIQRKN